MSVTLNDVKAAVAAGDDRLAVKHLWFVKAQARDAETIEGLIELAEKVGERSSGGRKRDCELIVTQSRNALKTLESGPLYPAVSLPPRFRVGIPVSTSHEVPGYAVEEYIGEVFGVIVRSRGAFPVMSAGLKQYVGGELKAMTNLLEQTRREALSRMVAEAVEREADAIICMRFDVSSMADTWTEVCSYGTAVKARKLTGLVAQTQP